MTGFAPLVDRVQTEAANAGIDTVTVYSSGYGPGYGMLIFTGGSSGGDRAYHIVGPSIASVKNDTDQPWYLVSKSESITVYPDTTMGMLPVSDAYLDNDPYSPPLSQTPEFSF